MPQPETHIQTYTAEAYTPRYWTYVDVRGPDECWPWLGGLDSSGYGVFNIGIALNKRRMVKAHRFGFDLANPVPIGPDECVCHTCDNRPCQNPAHWFRGSKADNHHDAIAKGRVPTKLTEADVYLLRALYEPGLVGFGSLARRFGIASSTAREIVLRQTWKHLA